MAMPAEIGDVLAEVSSAESGDVVAAVSSAAAAAEVASAESADVVAAVSSAAAEVASSDAAAVAGGGAGAPVAVTGGVAISRDEIISRILSRFPTRSDFLASVWALGNHQTVRLIWAVVGVICGTLAPLYLVMSVHGLARVHALSDRGECYCYVQHVRHAAASAPGAADLMLIGGIVTGVTYWASYYCRSIRFFRAVQRPWYFGPIGNGTVFVVSYYIAVAHHNTESAIIGFLLLAGVALAFIEIVRPVMDYGFLQTFLKMPLVVAFAYYDGFRLTGWGFYVPCVLVVIYGTFVMPWFHSDRPARVRAREIRPSLGLTLVADRG